MRKNKKTTTRAGITLEKNSGSGPVAFIYRNIGLIVFGVLLFAAGATWIVHDFNFEQTKENAPEVAKNSPPKPAQNNTPITPDPAPTQPPGKTPATVAPTTPPKPATPSKPVFQTKNLFPDFELPDPPAQPATPPPGVPGNTAPEQTSPATVDKNKFPRPALTLVEAQIELARRCFSCGPIDGKPGTQTTTALGAFQSGEGLPATGKLDDATRERLILTLPPFAKYTVTVDDVARLQPISNTWVGKSEQNTLEYETVLELVSEKTHAHQSFVRQLNPGTKWTTVTVGSELLLPAVDRAKPKTKAAQINIFIADHVLEARDAAGNIIAHFPVSIAKSKEKRPNGQLHVKTVAPNPNYTFDPAVFPESDEAASIGRKLILPPGPNNPVGVAWIGLDLPGYGIHGTPYPEQVGRTESHGCFRLANWDAKTLIDLVRVGLPVTVSP